MTSTDRARTRLMDRRTDNMRRGLLIRRRCIPWHRRNLYAPFYTKTIPLEVMSFGRSPLFPWNAETQDLRLLAGYCCEKAVGTGRTICAECEPAARGVYP